MAPDGDGAVRWRRGDQALSIELMTGARRRRASRRRPLAVAYKDRRWEIEHVDGRIHRARKPKAAKAASPGAPRTPTRPCSGPSGCRTPARAAESPPSAAAIRLRSSASSTLERDRARFNSANARPIRHRALAGASSSVGEHGDRVRSTRSLRRDFIAGYAANAMIIGRYPLPEQGRPIRSASAVAPDAVVVFHDGDTVTILPRAVGASYGARARCATPSENPTPVSGELRTARGVVRRLLSTSDWSRRCPRRSSSRSLRSRQLRRWWPASSTPLTSLQRAIPTAEASRDQVPRRHPARARRARPSGTPSVTRDVTSAFNGASGGRSIRHTIAELPVTDRTRAIRTSGARGAREGRLRRIQAHRVPTRRRHVRLPTVGSPGALTATTTPFEPYHRRPQRSARRAARHVLARRRRRGPARSGRHRDGRGHVRRTYDFALRHLVSRSRRSTIRARDRARLRVRRRRPTARAPCSFGITSDAGAHRRARDPSALALAWIASGAARARRAPRRRFDVGSSTGCRPPRQCLGDGFE